MLAHGTVEGVDARAHNDMPVICSETSRRRLHQPHGFLRTLFEIGPDAEVVDTHSSTSAPISRGHSPTTASPTAS